MFSTLHDIPISQKMLEKIVMFEDSVPKNRFWTIDLNMDTCDSMFDQCLLNMNIFKTYELFYI